MRTPYLHLLWLCRTQFLKYTLQEFDILCTCNVISYCSQLCKQFESDSTYWLKVAVPGTETVQPPPKWEMKCNWVVDKIPQCRVRFFPQLQSNVPMCCRSSTSRRSMRCLSASVSKARPRSALSTKFQSGKW